VGKRNERRARRERVEDARADSHPGVVGIGSVEGRRLGEVDGAARKEERRKDACGRVVARRQVDGVSRVERVEREGRREEENGRRERAAPRADDAVRGEDSRAPAEEDGSSQRIAASS
jgi:hypothetical protein